LGTIRNDDAQPSISINDVSQVEGNSGTTSFVFTASLSNPSSQTVTVNYSTADGTATVASGDYANAAGSLTFAPGQTSQTVSVAVNGDVTFEPDETFSVNLSGAVNATLADATGLGTIRNDDGQPNDAPVFISTPDTFLTVDPQADPTLGRAFQAATGPVTHTLFAKDGSKYEAGYYLVDDAEGRVAGLLPGQAGYTEAALAAGRAAALYNATSTVNTVRQVNLQAGAWYGYYLIVSPKKVTAIGTAPTGPAPYGANVFFSFEGANPEAFDQLRVEVDGSALKLKWEGLVHGGDGSYGDFVIAASGLAIPTGGGQGSYSYLAQADDVDGDGLTYSLITAPAGATIDMDTGLVSLPTATIGLHTFTIGVTDGNGGDATQTFQLEVVGRTAVSAFAATPTGFHARFDHAVDPETINLYGDTPDVLLMNAGTPVTGTLILDADHAGFSFVKSGSPLGNGSYTVTLRSDADAFKGLDGNGDGTAGDDYTGSLTINNGASLARVSINDATRGPGQAVDGALFLSLTSNPGANITSVRFNVRYDPALLTLTGADLAAGLPAGGKVVATLTTPGLARFTVSSPTAMPAGTVKLVNLKGSIPLNGPNGAIASHYGKKQLLDVIDVVVNSTQAGLDDDAVHVAAYIADASGNRRYTTLDVQRIERVATGLDSGFPVWRNVDPRLIADVNGDGVANLTDRDIVSQEVQFLAGTGGADRTEIPPIPAGVAEAQFSGPDPLVALPDDLTAVRGQTLIVPVYLDTAENLESVQLTLGYDPQALEVLAVRPGSLTQEFPYFIERHDNGTVYVDTSGPRLAGGAGSLIELEVRVKDTAIGPLAIDFQSAALNEGHLTIGVLPTAGSDPTDGRITIASSEIPGSDLTSDDSRVADFFESFNAKLAVLVRRIGAFFESDTGIDKPVMLLPRVSQPKSVAALQAPTVDLTGKLASFAVAGNETVTSRLNDGQRWKRELAGAAETQATNPNSKLHIPAGPGVTRVVAGK
jgi:hypothetical protein